MIPQVLESLSISYEVLPEEEFFEDAIEVASKTGAAGFGCYFMALAMVRDALLITDDEKMVHHARLLGVRSLLVREVSEEEI
ncbi:nuclease, partial [Thermococcus sp. GR7]|nr:nuclease [Thermococcus sp. GR7]